MNIKADIAIIGRGFSGTALAIALLRHAQVRLSIALIGRDDAIGRGIAYSTPCKEHLLNVVASKMSAIAEVPTHFVEWLSKTYGLKDVSDRFIPRSLYGEYVEETLKIVQAGSVMPDLYNIAGAALSLSSQSGGFTVNVMSSHPNIAQLNIAARCVVLATGNCPSSHPPEVRCRSSDYYVGYPWAENALKNVRPTDRVLILGTGLTAVDQLLTLNAQGFEGSIQMISARGRLPQKHERSSPWALGANTMCEASTRALFHNVREEVRTASLLGIGWQSVIDSIRPHSQTIWRGLSLEEKSRFLRHVRSIWDVHRHRVPPPVDKAVSDLIYRGTLKVIAGRCIKVQEESGVAKVVYRRRGTDSDLVLLVDKVINCTGPTVVSRMADDPLVKSLFSSGLVRLDPLGLGFDVAEGGALIDANGRVSDRLFALGPLRKGYLWETTAVPEIRSQAVELAKQLLLSK